MMMRTVSFGFIITTSFRPASVADGATRGLCRVFAVEDIKGDIVNMEGMILSGIAMQHPYFGCIQVHGIIVHIVRIQVIET